MNHSHCPFCGSDVYSYDTSGSPACVPCVIRQMRRRREAIESTRGPDWWRLHDEDMQVDSTQSSKESQ